MAFPFCACAVSVSATMPATTKDTVLILVDVRWCDGAHGANGCVRECEVRGASENAKLLGASESATCGVRPRVRRAGCVQDIRSPRTSHHRTIAPSDAPSHLRITRTVAPRRL